MTPNWWYSLLLSCILCLLIIPLVRIFSIRMGFVASPRNDRWSNRPTALFGGVAIFFSVILTLLIIIINVGWNRIEFNNFGFILGSLIMFLVGLFDDFRELSPPAKLIGQILAASIVIYMGFTTHFFTPRIENPQLAQLFNIMLTFIWIIGVTNAINLLDNMDGLAGGVACIASIFLSFFFWEAHNYLFLVVSLAFSGSLIGYLFFNFPPAKIYMGDSGSLFIGFTLAVLSIARQPQASNVFAVMGIPTLLFLLPILDTVFVAFTRVMRGVSPFQGGRDHTSHRLIAFGFSERKTLFILYGVAILSGLIAAFLESIKYWYSLVIVPLLIISLALISSYLGGKKLINVEKHQQSLLTKAINELTFRHRILEIILDFFLISISFYLAFLFNFKFVMNENRMEIFIRYLPIALIGVYSSYFIFGVYKGIWKYFGIVDLVRFLKASLGGITLVAFLIYFIISHRFGSFLFYSLFGIFTLLSLTGSRSTFHLMKMISELQNRNGKVRVLILGAGDRGEIVLRWMNMHPQFNYQPVGYVDKDPYLLGKQIHGIKIIGNMETLGKNISDHLIQGIILALDEEITSNEMQSIEELCQKNNIWIKKLIFDVIAVDVNANTLIINQH